MTSPTEEEFSAAADAELKAVVTALDATTLDLDVELSADILTIEFNDGRQYIINRHGAARQIWMAANRSAWHFDWHPETASWVAHKSGEELWEVLSAALSRGFGISITLRRP